MVTILINCGQQTQKLCPHILKHLLRDTATVATPLSPAAQSPVSSGSGPHVTAHRQLPRQCRGQAASGTNYILPRPHVCVSSVQCPRHIWLQVPSDQHPSLPLPISPSSCGSISSPPPTVRIVSVSRDLDQDGSVAHCSVELPTNFHEVSQC